MNFQFSGPSAKAPAHGAQVRGRIRIESCVPGQPPVRNYDFTGTFIGECADGFMVSPKSRSDWTGTLDDRGTIFCRQLAAA